MADLDTLARRVETLSGEVLAMQATWADSLALAKQMLQTSQQLVLQMTRLVETLEGAVASKPETV